MPAKVLPLAEIAPLLAARGALIGLDLGSKTINVVFDDASANAAVIQKAISGAGYVSHR